MGSRFILGISTSSGVARVAALAEPAGDDQAEEMFCFEIVDYKSQSAQILPLIHLNMGKVGAKPADCAALAVDIGPGGFTSLRTACGIAQGLAVAWNVPAIPLTSFECMLPNADVSELPVTVLMDARLNEIYAACLYRTPEGTAWVKHAYLLAMGELHSVIGPVICDAALFAQMQNPAPGVVLGRVSAVQLVKLAWLEFLAGRVASAFDCQPLYVRDKVAQTTSERLAFKHGAV